MSDRSLSPKYAHCGQKIGQIEQGRLLTLTETRNVRHYDSGESVRKLMSIKVEEVTQLTGARAAVITGTSVTNSGEPRKNGVKHKLLVAEGSFVVWW